MTQVKRTRGRPRLSDAEKKRRAREKQHMTPKIFTQEWLFHILEKSVTGTWNTIVAVVTAIGKFIQNNWRESLAFIALVLLATSAAYGVFVFSLLFVPYTFALITAGAFEFTYIGLGVARLKGNQRVHAMYISTSAVVVSVLYNTISAVLHILGLTSIALFAGISTATGLALVGLWVLVIFFALLHGAPLALTAFFLSNLILHKNDDSAEVNNMDLVITRMITLGYSDNDIYAVIGGNAAKTRARIKELRAMAS